MGREPAGFDTATRLFRQLEIPFSLAVTLLEHAELTDSEASLAEARQIFEQLGAKPWIERVSAAPQRTQVSA